MTIDLGIIVILLFVVIVLMEMALWREHDRVNILIDKVKRLEANEEIKKTPKYIDDFWPIHNELLGNDWIRGRCTYDS